MNTEKLLDIADRMERHAALLLKQARNLRSMVGQENYKNNQWTADFIRCFDADQTVH